MISPSEMSSKLWFVQFFSLVHLVSNNFVQFSVALINSGIEKLENDPHLLHGLY